MNDTVIEIIDLHKNELDLIKLLRRSVRFGEITIYMRNGIPIRIERIKESIKVGGNDLT